jgi:hypothetical protein
MHISYIDSTIAADVARITDPSSLGQHILDALPVGFLYLLLELILCQPLEVLQAEFVLFQVDLTGHDACFQEESLGTVLGEPGWDLLGGLCVVKLVVANRHVAH